MILKRKHSVPICSPYTRGLFWDQTQPSTTNYRFFPKVTIIPLLPPTRLTPRDGPDRAAYYLILGLLVPGFISDDTWLVVTRHDVRGTGCTAATGKTVNLLFLHDSSKDQPVVLSLHRMS